MRRRPSALSSSRRRRSTVTIRRSHEPGRGMRRRTRACFRPGTIAAHDRPVPARASTPRRRSTTPRSSGARTRPIARLFLGPVRWRTDTVRGRPVHDDRRHGRRPIVQRPYSVASPPAVTGTDGYEFYVRLVQGGTFTPLLWDLPIGHGMRMIGPKGKFMLQPDDDRTHIFISSGTGNAPFVAMMRQLLIDGRPRPVVFLNGVSYATSSATGRSSRIGRRPATYPVPFVPTVSRPDDPRNAEWTGRTGRVEIDPRAGPRRARPDAGQLDRLHLRQPGHDPVGRGDPARARLPRGPGPQGALLAEGQGAARRGRRAIWPPRSTPPRRTPTSSGCRWVRRDRRDPPRSATSRPMTPNAIAARITAINRSPDATVVQSRARPAALAPTHD